MLRHHTVLRLAPMPMAVLGAVFLLLAPAGAAGELPRPDTEFRHLTTAGGLAHGTVYSISQDQVGFLWFATEAGLTRYDGYGFTSFTHQIDQPVSISSDDVSITLVDSSGALWIGTWGGGLNRFDATTETFTVYRHDPADPGSLPDDRVQTLFEDQAGTLWIGTNSGGLSRFDAHSGGFVTLRHDPETPVSLSANRVWSMCEGDAHILWIGTRAGLDRLDRDSGAVTSYRLVAGDRRSLPPGNVRALALDRRGELWVGTGRGLGRFSPTDGTFTPVAGSTAAARQLRGIPINTIRQAPDGALWIGTAGSGLFAIDLDGGDIAHFTHDRHLPRSLANNDVRSLYVDRSEVLWIATRGGGVDSLDLKPPKFEQAVHDPDDPASLSEGWVASFLEDSSGTLWVGTANGLDRHDPGKDGFAHYRHLSSDPSSLPARAVQCLCEDRAGTLWVGTLYGGLSRFDRHTGSFETFQYAAGDDGTLSDNRVSAIVEDSDGTLWVGTAAGLNRFDPQRRRFTRFMSTAGNPHSLSDDMVWAIIEDRQRQLWIATQSGGLNRYDRDSGGFLHYLPVAGDDGSLSSRRVMTLYEDSGGVLWIGTADGLNARFPGSDRFRRYTTADGLPADMINGILGDATGYLWISTSHGLCRFDPEGGTFRSYTAADGLQVSFRSGACLQASDGRLYFGGTTGYNLFFPDKVIDNSHAPAVVLSSFRRFDQEITFDRPTWLVDEITLSYRDNFFALELAALDFTDPLRNRYRYILEGFDREWNEPGTRRFASYTNVDPGRYLLRAQACNSDGVWNEQGLQVAIRVVPPLWQTTWFRIATVLLLIATAVTLLQVKTAAQRRRQRQLEEQVRLRTAELRQANQQISEQNRQLTELSRTDPLTGLWNRRVLVERIQLEMAILRRRLDADEERDRCIGVFLFDLDHFKQINDTYGHEAGDQVLKAIAKTLKADLREIDLAVRWGGDELVVLARGQSSQGIEVLADRLQASIAATRVSHEANPGEASVSLSLTASGGFLCYPLSWSDLLPSDDWPLLIEAADHLMYQAKTRGRARLRGVVRDPDRQLASGERQIIGMIINDTIPLPSGLRLTETETVTACSGARGADHAAG